MTPVTNAAEGRFPRLGLTPAECKFARARARGWNDVRAGLGFRDAYDTWGRKQQFAYERGRFQATLAKRFLRDGLKTIAIWRRDETLWGPLDRSCGHDMARAIELDTRVARRRLEKVKESK